MPPRDPTRYEAECAHQSAMNRACCATGTAAARNPCRWIAPFTARKNPAIPASRAVAAMHCSNAASGRIRSRADTGGREPARAARARRIPKPAPTHHVAKIPQPSASSVGDSVGKIRGWPIVKYSTQTLAVIWSCRMPYMIAAATLSSQILIASITSPWRVRLPKTTSLEPASPTEPGGS